MGAQYSVMTASGQVVPMFSGAVIGLDIAAVSILGR